MTYTVPDGVAFVDGADYGVDDRLYLMAVPDGRPAILEGAGRLIWTLAASGTDDVLAETARLTGRPADDIAGEVALFLRDLMAAGLLVASRAGQAGGNASG